MVVENVGRGQRDIPHRGSGRREPRRRSARAAPGYRRRRGPMPGCGKSRCAARRTRGRPGAGLAPAARARISATSSRLRQMTPERVEVVALHLDADAAELAKARLVADDAAEGRRPDRRAAGLGAEPDRHLEIGDRGGRAARRAARRVRRIVRMDGFPGMAVGEFGRHRLAEDDPAGGADQRDAGGIGKGPVAAVDRRAVLGRHVDRVDDVLDPDRNPGQQARSPGAVDRARLGQRLLRVEPHPGLDLGAGTGPLEAIADQGLGGQRAGGKARRRLAGGQALGAAHGRSPRSSRRSTQSPTSSSRASSCRQPTS